jgi:hypothetical protein
MPVMAHFMERVLQDKLRMSFVLLRSAETPYLVRGQMMTLGGAAEIVIFSGLIEEIRYHD